MIAVTAHITTDVAAAPFIWVIPLALYLLTFVAVFRERPWVKHSIVMLLTPFVIAPLAITLLRGDQIYWLVGISLHPVGFFVLALLCHGELYARRPAPARLTEFYLWVSFGGVLGGIFAGLAAPYLFNSTYEYPILVAASVLVLPGAFRNGMRGFVREAGPILALAALVAVGPLVLDLQPTAVFRLPLTILLIALVGVMIWRRKHPAQLFALVLFAFSVTAFWQPDLERVETSRSFFGVHRVVEMGDGRFRVLFHGTTVHGAERILNDDGTPNTDRPEPLTYYYFGGPIWEAIDATRARKANMRVAAVGLGTGSLACHIWTGESWTFYEIDPEVVRIARDPRLFGFISSCAPELKIVLGDARLTLAAATESYDLIALDAFSSDAIPVHLLTREAFAGYLSRLSPRGVIVVHISNRHMELARVLAAVADTLGLVAYGKQDRAAGNFLAHYKANAIVGVLARDAADLGGLPNKPDWWRIAAGDVVPWTDDYSDLIRAILRKKLGN
jgi:hypothetical protein